MATSNLIVIYNISMFTFNITKLYIRSSSSKYKIPCENGRGDHNQNGHTKKKHTLALQEKKNVL